MSTFHKCAFCDELIDWENGGIWECEKCGTDFCESCFIEKCGNQAFFDTLCADGKECVLCPDCYKETHTTNSMKDIVADMKEKEAIDKFYGLE